jgi:hypothetical protein
MDCFVARDGTAGPHLSIAVNPMGPGLFQAEPGLISSIHANGNAITENLRKAPGFQTWGYKEIRPLAEGLLLVLWLTF